jgi:hypothetical protein
MGNKAKTPLSIWAAYLLLLYIVAASAIVIVLFIQRLSLTISDLIQGPAFWWYLLLGLASLVAMASLALRLRFSRWLTVVLLALVVSTSLFSAITTGLKYSLLDVVGGIAFQSIYHVPAIAVTYAMLFSDKVKLYFGLSRQDDPPPSFTAAD